ncbi:SAM-dependent methyltransferase [Halobacteriales archaeon QS_4_70_19]|nr:MAG: SAM-dependent methyltransferase [Halobacteriales archaeon QS_4_70_19]
MDESQRESLRDTARYLRNVRPIDPEEVFEYVDGQPHPGVVKQTLRELAPELGLVETDAGTFEPAPEEPVPAWRARGVPERVEALPETHTGRLADLLVEQYGPGWPDGESGDRLRARLREVKEHYLHGGDVEYDDRTALAYALYHLPGYYASVQYVLDDLAKADLLDRHLRVLDVGAGVGGPALGLADYLPDDALVDYHAVEPAAAADVLEALLEGTGRNVHPTVHRETAEAFAPAGPLGEDASDDARGWDLVLFSNVLSELADPSGTARRYLDVLAPDGSFLALAPADRNTAMGLRGVERALVDHGGEDAATVWGPTLRLWPDTAPSDTCWSFDVRPDLSVPGFQRALDRGERGPRAVGDDDREQGDGEFVNVDVQFAYSVLRRDGHRAIDFRPSRDRFARLADSEAHVTDRVNVVAVKLSHDLTDEPGANPLFRIGDGSQAADHFAVLVDEDALNAPLREADYGDLLTFERVLILWNDDEAAYNLVVDEGVVVESTPVPP